MWAEFFQSFQEAIFAALGTLGFACIAKPPIKTVITTAFLAAIVFGLRYYLLYFLSFNIVVATFIASLFVGFSALFFARMLRVPAEIISLPAVIPMIPGMYAYQTILSFEAFFQNKDANKAVVYLVEMMKNLLTTTFITLAIAIGITLSLFVFYEQSLMMTRSLKHDKRSFWKFLKSEF
ncbi:hypothetical protein CCZ01_03280 [Helicobacter monodelphidis]|uniref:threonine/serine exporter family protein n=1 Tax=Helicobacter sp. 15-1451 TaxID=2004995 RepID=UPI000DCD6E69|nr:threonine/serine exporter family protein [Helicobacter sp. 15-1451]RAX58115.1 hypothetical protein CCZ01_03280 [Helicobacter sp. 15-1451]